MMRYLTTTMASGRTAATSRVVPQTLDVLKRCEWATTPNTFIVSATNAHAHDGPGGLP